MDETPFSEAATGVRPTSGAQRVLRTLGWTPTDPQRVPAGTHLARLSIVHGASAEVIWGDDQGAETIATCSFANDLTPRPVAGDWVVLRDGHVVAVLARRSSLRRPDPSQRDAQILAANLDLVLLVVPIDRGLNIRMLERFAIMAWDSGAQPFVVLSKVDEAKDVTAIRTATTLAVPGVEVLTTSSRSGEGLERLRRLLHEGVTAVMLGASGAGKTSLLNALEGRREATRDVSRRGEGRHVTTTRKLYRLSSGGVLLDIPGIRLLDLMVGQGGVNETFTDVADLAIQCRFRDCAHGRDEGCAVVLAVSTGALSATRLENWRLVQSELALQGRRRDPTAAPARRRRRKTSPRDPPAPARDE